MPQVLILGATSDIAVALAHKFGDSGSDLQLAARNTEALETLKTDLEIRYQVTVTTHEFDATQFDQHEEFYHGLSVAPDIAICVFGYMGEQPVAAKEWSEAKRIMDTTYTGAVSIFNIIANDFEKRQRGVMIGISSVAGERGRQSNYIYGSAKAGLTAYLSGLRNRLADKNVHVITVKPGFVNTKMTEGLDLPELLTAQPSQVAKSIFKAVKKKKNILYVLAIWRLVMLIIKMIPEGIFKKLKL